MRILLDECVPRPLNELLVGHDCVTVQDRGWSGVKNGELLDRSAGEFALFITSDQNIRYQQNLAGKEISVLQLSTNDWRRLRAAADLIVITIESIKSGELKLLAIP